MRAQEILSTLDPQMVGKYNNHYHSGNSTFPIFLALFREIFHIGCFGLDVFNLYSKKECLK